jgi:hypothetical protein
MPTNLEHAIQRYAGQSGQQLILLRNPQFECADGFPVVGHLPK